MEPPFEITRRDQLSAVGSNGRMVVTNELNGGHMFRRRSTKPGRGNIEMLVADAGDGVRVYVHQYENGVVEIVVSRREIYI